MKQFISFIIKEAKHIVRDKRTMLILFGMPIIMMLLFGYAVRNDVRNVRTVIVMSNTDYVTQQAVDRLSASEYFTITQLVATPAEAEQAIRDQKADLAIIFGKDYASVHSGLQFIVDGADPNMAQQWTQYANAVITNPNNGLVNTKLLYNPQMKSAYNFVPADSAKTVKLAILTKYMWFDAYAETVGLDFIKENAPRIILVTGTPGYTRYRTEVIGSAEGGYKVRLGKVNALTDDQLKDYGSMNNYYFHTMHHEFMHILNQKKPYDESYDNISRSDYVSGNWTSIPDKKAQSMGFVSAYSMENPAEDIAELYSIYVTSTPEDWATIMKNAGNKGGTIINKKLKIIREYMSNSWNVDIELLRNAILRRGGKIGTLDLNTLN